MRFVRLILIIFLIVKPELLLSQPDSLHKPVVIGLHGSYGFIIPHSGKIRELSNSNPFSLELNFALHLTSEDVWKYCYCYPRLGAALHFVDFGNREEIGSAFALYPYIEPYIGAGRRLSMAVRFGLGFSYQNTIYDETLNPRNLFFGSHFAFIAMLNASLNLRLGENISSRLTFSYNHLSNGGFIQPNLGINYPLLGLGMDYVIRPYDFEEREKKRGIVLNPDRSRFDLALFFSGREGKDFDRWFGVYGIWAGYSHMLGRLSAIYTGAELVSDHLLRERVLADYRDGTTDELPDHKRLSILLGHELVLGRFLFSQYAGIYIYSPATPPKPWYQRYALLYRFAPSTWIGVNARSHYQVIDFIDLRLVRSF